ncbi:MAG: hypothetical protein JXX29_16810 [Deltaproteobacteria bacterium]|nr:hypothetical protein [Deltaproteobacteria bacterium]MBN2673347.1 hypothetical protein [Deltaproteobacteria bacterium]
MMESDGTLHRDTDRSAFADILSHIDGVCPGFKAAVFYDAEGETIDYHSYLDPFDTRLAAAHIGVVVSTATRAFQSLSLGKLEQMEIHADHLDSVTVCMGDDLFLSVIVSSGNLNQFIYRKLIEVIRDIRREINS